MELRLGEENTKSLKDAQVRKTENLGFKRLVLCLSGNGCHDGVYVYIVSTDTLA